MNKYLLSLVLTTLVSINCFSQITFENGYFITDDDQKVDCLIKNVDWRNNPTRFEYKLSQSDEAKIAEVASVKEFSIPGDFKFVGASVNIDRFSDDLRYMSTERKPDFKEERLFLKVLVEGKASLYHYEDTGLVRFFYKTDNTEIQQLIYKPYRADRNAMAENNQFRQQLFVDLECPGISKKDVENIAYSRKELESLFVKYNICHDPNYVPAVAEQKKGKLNFTVRPGVNFGQLKVVHPDAEFSENYSAVNTGYRIGAELEYIMPFNKGKWAVIVEPTYQAFEAEHQSKQGFFTGTIVTAKVNYKSLEVPVGIRHYFFLNNTSRLFLNASYIADIVSDDSNINLTWNNSSRISTYELKTSDNLAFGAGFKYTKSFSLEVRYQTPRELLSNYRHISAGYKTYSLILGYTLPF